MDRPIKIGLARLERQNAGTQRPGSWVAVFESKTSGGKLSIEVLVGDDVADEGAIAEARATAHGILQHLADQTRPWAKQ